MSFKNKDILHFIYYFLNLIFLIFVFLAYLISNSSLYPDFFISLGRNWMNGPVNKINTSIQKSCQPSETTLIGNPWPGYLKGCVLIDQVYVYSRKSRCPSTASLYPEIPPVSYNKWRNATLCGNRLLSSYFDLTFVQKDRKCPSGSKPCGVLDSLNNQLCVSDTMSCPINKVLFLDSTSSIPGDYNYDIINFQDGKKLLFTNGDNKGDIFKEFTVSDLNPCVDTYYSNYAVKAYGLDPYFERDKCLNGIG